MNKHQALTLALELIKNLKQQQVVISPVEHKKLKEHQKILESLLKGLCPPMSQKMQ